MTLIPAGATRQLGKLALLAKKNSPHIAFGLGLAGAIGGTVLACRATLRLEATLDEIREDMAAVKELERRQLLSKEENSRNTAIVYLKSSGKIVRLYGPAAAVGAVSLFLLAGSHRQLTNRNKDLTVAFAALMKVHQEYRARVAQELGPEREELINKGYVNTDPKSKEPMQLADPYAVNPFHFIFDENSTEWEKNCAINLATLEASEAWWTRKLRSRGYVYLSEVLQQLGIEPNGMAGMVGWIYNGEGDNYVDFGFRSEEAFMEGLEPRVWLDFNCDGPIWDKF